MKKTLKPNYLGRKYLEQYNKITIKEILQKVTLEVQKQILDIELDWIEIVKTKANYWGFRLWFKCPECSNKSFILYNINWNLKCRKCSWLNYKKQRFKWMLEEKLYKI